MMWLINLVFTSDVSCVSMLRNFCFCFWEKLKLETFRFSVRSSVLVLDLVYLEVKIYLLPQLFSLFSSPLVWSSLPMNLSLFEVKFLTNSQKFEWRYLSGCVGLGTWADWWSPGCLGTVVWPKKCKKKFSEKLMNDWIHNIESLEVGACRGTPTPPSLPPSDWLTYIKGNAEATSTLKETPMPMQHSRDTENSFVERRRRGRVVIPRIRSSSNELPILRKSISQSISYRS